MCGGRGEVLADPLGRTLAETGPALPELEQSCDCDAGGLRWSWYVRATGEAGTAPTPWEARQCAEDRVLADRLSAA
jgi:hypothetical protein